MKIYGINVHISDFLDEDNLRVMLDEGYITKRSHDTLPFFIYNYTNKAAYSGIWNQETIACRGLIADNQGNVIARPFGKFFNIQEHESPNLPNVPNEPFQVYEKLDGCLGIYFSNNCLANIATRGSFHSPQAEWATSFYRNHYSSYKIPENHTYLFEIIAPQFRIVLDYKGLEQLVLLVVIDKNTGKDVDIPADWPGPVVQRFDGLVDIDKIMVIQRTNAEGFVVRFVSGLRVKIKHDEYVRLHKVLSGLSTVRVWENLSAGLPIESLLDILPDEWHAWTLSVAKDLQEKYKECIDNISSDFVNIVASTYSRKDFANLALKSVHSSALFLLFDKKSIDNYVWKCIKPQRTLAIDASLMDG